LKSRLLRLALPCLPTLEKRTLSIFGLSTSHNNSQQKRSFVVFYQNTRHPIFSDAKEVFFHHDYHFLSFAIMSSRRNVQCASVLAGRLDEYAIGRGFKKVRMQIPVNTIIIITSSCRALVYLFTGNTYTSKATMHGQRARAAPH
jgi:hypothetical protein